MCHESFQLLVPPTCYVYTFIHKNTIFPLSFQVPLHACVLGVTGDSGNILNVAVKPSDAEVHSTAVLRPIWEAMRDAGRLPPTIFVDHYTRYANSFQKLAREVWGDSIGNQLIVGVDIPHLLRMLVGPTLPKIHCDFDALRKEVTKIFSLTLFEPEDSVHYIRDGAHLKDIMQRVFEKYQKVLSQLQKYSHACDDAVQLLSCSLSQP